MKKEISELFAELIGTFFLVFGGCGALMLSSLYPDAFSPVSVPLAFGLIIGLMVYVLGGISGAHFNPSITLALALSKRFSWKKVIPYIIAQCVGATIASLVLVAILPATPTMGVTAPSVIAWQAVVWEAVLTGILVSAVLCIVCNEGTFVISGLVVGCAIFVIGILGGPTSGGSVNLARSFGPALVAGDFSNFWIYIVGPFAGATLASFVFSSLIVRANKG